MTQLVTITADGTPALIAAAGDRAACRYLESFTAQIRNPNTRRAYVRAVVDFLAWLEAQGVASIAGASSLHVAAYVEQLTRSERSAPTVKQQLAAIRRLFDWLAAGGVLPFNPASAVRGPSHSAKTGATPVLDPQEARQLLDAIDIGTPIGLRDRALIGLMVYSFARIGAATGMKVDDVFTRAADSGCGCTRRAASGTRCPATIILRLTCTATLMAAGLPRTPGGRCSARSAGAPAS